MTLSWICPFLYLNGTLGSILHGLGKTNAVFWDSVLSLTLRILFVWFAIPIWGIQGYLLGLLASQLLSFVLSLLVLSRSTEVSFTLFRKS
jgi:stage V sporulation protein B